MSVYKPCDIRGPVTELSANLYRSWGRSIAQRLTPGAPVCVGGDVRRSTPAFQVALVEGLRAGGANVHDLGILPTPMVYWAGRQSGAAACAIITASHSPPDINGLKWVIGELPPTEAEVAELARETFAENVIHGRDDRAPRPDVRRGGTDPVVPARRAVEAGGPPPRGHEDIAAGYQDWLRAQVERWAAAMPSVPRNSMDERLAALTVVLDPGNGCWAERCGPYFRALFPRTRFVAMHDRPDGTFPERDPDSARAENLGRLRERVIAEKADLGVAFDGDGDRVSFVDGTGAVSTAEQTTWVLLQFCGPALAGRAVVYDIKFADLVATTVRQLRGRAQVERSGHAFIRTRMIKENGLFGAEVSGHYFYGDLHGGDDGFYAAARLLWHLAASGRSLAAWRAQCPPVFLTPDLRVRVDAKDTPRLLAEAKRVFADRPLGEVDGLRVEFTDGWALMRGSVTEPALTFRFEGRDAAALERVVAEFSGRLGDLGARVMGKYRGK